MLIVDLLLSYELKNVVNRLSFLVHFDHFKEKLSRVAELVSKFCGLIGD